MNSAFSPKIFDWVELHSPAKVNLRLKVTGRRSDGYHLLSMLNCLVAFGDTVRVRLLPQSGCRVATRWQGEGIGPDLLGLDDPKSNLAARAALMFFERFEIPLGIEIEILKCVPLGGGLGGGSGNAAVVFNYLAQTFADEYGVTESNLLELAEKIGADVPYMMAGGLGLVTGVGERVVHSAEHGLKGEPIWLICPHFGVATAEVFAQLRKCDESSFAPDIAILRNGAIQNATRGELFELIDNDLIEKAMLVRPELGSLLAILNSIPGMIVSMSGSGSTLFALYEPARQGEGERQAVLEMLGSKLKSAQVEIIPTLIL